MAETVRLRVNGAERSVSADPDTRLLGVLRSALGLTARTSAAAPTSAAPAT